MFQARQGFQANCLWVTLLSILLIVTWAISPAEADHCKGQHKNDPGCDGGGGPPNNDPPPSLARSAIVYVNGNSIKVADADGSNQTTLFSRRRAVFWNPSWSPDGNTMIFTSDMDPEGPGIYRIRIDRVNGTVEGPDKIIPLNDVITAGPAWSPVATPDGTFKIAYSDFDEFENRGVLYIMDLDETGEPVDSNGDGNPDPFRLSTYPLPAHENFHENYPSWSPDASKLAIRTWDDSRFLDGVEIITLGTDCGINGPPLCEVPLSRRDLIAELLPLTFQPLINPVWANTGNRIAEVGIPELSGNEDIWVIEFDDTDTMNTQDFNLTSTNNANPPDRGENSPTWSPDDSQIMYQGWDYLCEPQTNKERGWNLIIRNVDGEPIDGCEEKLIVKGGQMPDWWRNADTLPPPAP